MNIVYLLSVERNFDIKQVNCITEQSKHYIISNYTIRFYFIKHPCRLKVYMYVEFRNHYVICNLNFNEFCSIVLPFLFQFSIYAYFSIK